MAMSGIATGLGWRGDDPNSLKVPAAPYVDVTDEQRRAAEGNLANFADIAKLAGKTNKAYVDEFLKALERLGIKDAFMQGSANLTSLMRGELPKDIESYISRKSAERGITSGTGGSEFSKYGELRNLGLTSLDVSNKALDAFSRWMASAPIRQFDFSTQFQDLPTRIATQQWNEVNRYNTQFLKNQIKMLPNNWEMMGAQTLDYVATWATTAASAGTSGMMGGGGGGGGGDYSGYRTNNAANEPLYGWQGKI